jgi:pimeloyl-ACP methyl ester carboxylesterase
MFRKCHGLMPFSVFVVLCNVLLFATAGVAFAGATSMRAAGGCVTPGSTHTLEPVLDGANGLIQVPANWNGTLLLYSHGYTFVGNPLTAADASDSLTGSALLQQGYALAGSSYSQNGWAVQQAFHDQIALLNYFDATCGMPTRTIPWGDSLGGMITAGLVQLYPNRFAGAVPMCGVLAGGVGVWNQELDVAFAFNLLLAGNTLQIVHIQDPSSTFTQALQILKVAQSTPQGRARIALTAALADTPGWFSQTADAPANNDNAAQEQNQYLWDSQVDFAFIFLARAELEFRAGGNPSWNIGVDYREQLQKSVDRKEVEALYQQAGLDLNRDLSMLNSTLRISPDPGAVGYLSKYISFNGDLNIPVLSMQTVGDGLVVNEGDQSYASVVRQTGNANLLRQVFVNRAGHCTFTPAENLVALQTLIHRLDTGRWDNSTNPALLNQEATALGPALNVLLVQGLLPQLSAFVEYQPEPFLRPFTLLPWC